MKVRVVDERAHGLALVLEAARLGVVAPGEMLTLEEIEQRIEAYRPPETAARHKPAHGGYPGTVL